MEEQVGPLRKMKQPVTVGSRKGSEGQTTQRSRKFKNAERKCPVDRGRSVLLLKLLMQSVNVRERGRDVTAML